MNIKTTLIVIFILLTCHVQGQHIASESLFAGDTAKPLINQSLFSDSLTSSFAIEIKQEVKLHRHDRHSEHVVIMQGEGWMTLGEKQFAIHAGDVIFIPKGMPHKVKVTSKESLKVLSIQSPYFDGKDRIMME